jgi:hypothetical protein
MYWLVISGKRSSIRTRLSHGEREANDSLQHLIAKEMKLSSSQFTAFINAQSTDPVMRNWFRSVIQC